MKTFKAVIYAVLAILVILAGLIGLLIDWYLSAWAAGDSITATDSPWTYFWRSAIIAVPLLVALVVWLTRQAQGAAREAGIA